MYLKRNGNSNINAYNCIYIVDGLNCTWGDWTAFSTCSAEGTQYRERVCESLYPGFTGMWCSRKDIDIQRCNGPGRNS